MNFASSAYQNNSPRLPTLVLIVLAAIYLLAGVTGHDPWKTEDAIHISIAHGFATQGNWLTPYIAGEPWPHTAPLYHWVAALTGKVFGGLLEFHNAARLATPLFGALFLVALSGASRAFNGKATGRITVLLAIGTLGLLTPIHDAQPAIAGLAFAAVAWWGGGLLLQDEPESRWRGAVLLGLGLGLSLPAHGLVGLLMAIAVLPALIIRRDLKSLILALLIALPLIVTWPLMLAERAPAFSSAWWQNELAEATFARSPPTSRHLEQLIWATWPVLPLAFWSLWLHRRQLKSLALPLLGTAVTLIWYLTGSPRSLGLLPVLIPLTILAAAGADRLRRSAASAFDWFGLMTFTFCASMIWLGGSAQIFGWPPAIARNFDKLAPGHSTNYSLLALTFAIVLTAGWLLSWRLRSASLRWAAGTTLMWALTTVLWLSWIDYAKSYRPVVTALHAALPQGSDCIERDTSLGTSQRASLDYFAGIRTVAPSRKRQCNWRLSIDANDRATPVGWIETWRGGRPSDRKERWYLDRRAQ